MTDKKNILLKVSPEFHKDLKIYVTLRDVTLQDYIVDLTMPWDRNWEVSLQM